MKNSSLLRILSAFSKDEIKRFGQFIDSPYFHSGRNLKPLYLLLKKHHPEFNSEKLKGENIFSSLYPGRIFDNKKSSVTLRVLFTEMTNLARKFIVYDKIEKGEAEYEYIKLQSIAFGEKKLLKYSFKAMSKAAEQLDKNEKSTDYYSKRLDTYNTLSFITLTMGKQKETQKYIQPSLLYIYAFTFQNLTRFLNNSFVNRFSFNIDFKGFDLIKKFILSFDTDLFNRECHDDGFGTKDMILYEYFIIRSRIDESDKESLINALEIYYRFYDRVTSSVRWYCFNMLFNRFIGRLRFDKIYSEKACELFDFIFEREYSSYNCEKIISLNPYFNIIRIKAYLLNPDKLLEFIYRFSSKISESIAGEVQNYSMSFYFFRIRNFGKCLECIAKNDKLGAGSILNKYKLKICSHFELGQFEESVYALDSFEHYLRRNSSISKIILEENMEFIVAVKALLNITNREGLKYFNFIETSRYSLFGEWFNEKINDLNKFQK